jgi:hypothetical protein
MREPGGQVAPETLALQWIEQFAQVDKLPLDLSKLLRFILLLYRSKEIYLIKLRKQEAICPPGQVA